MVEIIPKPEVKISSRVDTLLYLAIALLIAAALSYFVLAAFQKNGQKTLEELKASLSQKETPELKNLEKNILEQKTKIKDFPLLLENHQKGSNFFSFLEKIAHPKVFFSKLDLNIKDEKVKIAGQTESFQTLGQQILLFEKEQSIRQVNLPQVSIGKEGEIEFAVELSLDPKIFK